MITAALVTLAVGGTVFSAVVGLDLLRRRRSAADQTCAMPDATNATPVVYRISVPWRIFLIAIGSVLIAGALISGAVWGNNFFLRGPGVGFLAVSGVTLLALLGVYFIVDTVLSKLSIYGEIGEIYDLLGTRKFRREDFSSRFVATNNAVRTLILIPKKADEKRLKLPMLFDKTGEVETWFSSVPSLDTTAEETLQAEIASNATHGPTPHARLSRLSVARDRAKFARWVGLGIAGWGWFAPRPYNLLIIVLLITPWIAIWLVARSQGIYTLNGSMKERRPDLANLLLMPGFILMLRALLDLSVLDWKRVVGWTIFTTAVLVGAATRADRGTRSKWPLLALCLLLCAYGYGASVLTNARLDRAPPVIYNALVLHKHISTGKSRTPELHLASWGPVLDASDVNVSWPVYNATARGATVCVELHPGFLGIRWYVVANCPK